MDKRRKIIIWTFLTSSSTCAGIAIITVGNHRAAQDYYYDVIPFGIWGAFFILLPLAAGLAVLLVRGLRMLAVQARKYREWKESLPPEQRAMVDLLELSALSAAAWELHEHHRRADAGLTRLVMGNRADFRCPDVDMTYDTGALANTSGLMPPTRQIGSDGTYMTSP